MQLRAEADTNLGSLGTWAARLGALLCLAALSGCLDSKVIKDNTILQPNLEEGYSSVYFLREDLGKPMGVVDNVATIEINGEPVLKLARGEYALLRIKPMEGTVTVKSLSIVGGDPYPKVVKGQQTFNFGIDHTNFVRLKLVNEEFRGMYFIPERIEFGQARDIAARLHPVGDAKSKPITKL